MLKEFSIVSRPTGPWGSKDWYVVHPSGKEWGAFTQRRDAKTFINHLRSDWDTERAPSASPLLRCKVCGEKNLLACPMTYCDLETPEECETRIKSMRKFRVGWAIAGCAAAICIGLLSYA